MSSEVSARCEKLRQTFEGREAILIEKGVVRVRVSHIEAKPLERSIAAEVRAIPTRGLPAGSLYYHAAHRAGQPFRISGGYLTCFSDHVWRMGYGGWTLLFAPQIVEGVVHLASRLPEDLDPFARYDEIARWLATQRAVADPTQDVFSKGSKNQGCH